MSGNPMWRAVCTTCSAVLGAASVTNGDEAAAVRFLSDGRGDDGVRLERLAPGDDEYPVKLGRLCVHHGGTHVAPDPNQHDLFGASA